MKGKRKIRVWLLLAMALLLMLPSSLSMAAAEEPEEEEIVWEVLHEENFQKAPVVPDVWTPDK